MTVSTTRRTAYRLSVIFLALALGSASAAAVGPGAEDLRRSQDYIAAFAALAAGLPGADRLATTSAGGLASRLTLMARVGFEAGDLFASRIAAEAAVATARRQGPDARPILAAALIWRAKCKQLQVGVGAAREDLLESRAIFDGLDGYHEERGLLMQAEANRERSAAGTVAAVPLYEAALAYRREHLARPHPDVADNLVWLAWNLNENGHREEAARLVDEAEAELSALGAPDHTLMATVLGIRFDHAHLRGDLEACRRHALHEIRIQESARAGFPFGHARARACPLLGYGRLLWVQLQNRHWEPAFQTWGLDQSSATRDFFRLSEWLDGPGAAVRHRFRRTYGELRSAATGLERAAAGDSTAAAIEVLRAWSDLQLAIRSTAADRDMRPIPSQDVRAALPPNTAVLGTAAFELGGRDLRHAGTKRLDRWLVVVRPDAPLRWVRGQTAAGDTLDALAREDRELGRTLERAAGWPTRLADDPQLEARLRSQAVRILGPAVAELAGIETVISIGTSLDLCFTCCPDFPAQVTFSPSVEIFTHFAGGAGAGQPPRSALLVGSQAAGPGGAPVDSGAELELLANLFPGATVLQGPSASEAALGELDRQEFLADLDLLHFAGHVRTSQAAEFSALILGEPAGGTADDGLLDVGELMFYYDLRPGLAVLAGCSSGRGGRRIWNEYFGVAQALIARGTPRVVASRWSVDDRATSLLIGRFYRNLTVPRDGEPPLGCAGALAEASQWLRGLQDADGSRPYAHPVYWGGFVVYGLP